MHAHNLLFKQMISLDLLEKQQDLVGTITTHGRNIIDDYGGWLKYQASKTKQHKTAVAAEQKKEKVATSRFWISIIASIIAGFLGGLSTDLFRSNKEPASITVMSRKQIDSLSRGTSAMNSQLKAMNKE
jgi:hypothetical protein